MKHWIDGLRAPLFVSWQITRDCDLCCLHCCTESAPGKRLADELDAVEALNLADQIVRSGVPYVMLCGGEPLVVPHFFALAEALGHADVQQQEAGQRNANDKSAGSVTGSRPLRTNRQCGPSEISTATPAAAAGPRCS